MPQGFISLPWLKPADPTGEFNAAFAQSAQVAEANARLQESANQTKLALTLKQQQQERENEQAQQQLEVQKQYHQQQVGMAKDRLKQAQQQIEAKAKTAAAQLDKVTQYNALTASGVPPQQAAWRVGLGTPARDAEFDKTAGTAAAAATRAESEKLRLKQVQDKMEGRERTETTLLDAQGNPVIDPSKAVGKRNEKYFVPKNPGADKPPVTGAAKSPSAGDVVKGYKFKGGDPSDKKNWEKVNE